MKEQRIRAGFLVITAPAHLQGEIPFFFGDNIIGRSDLKASIVLRDNEVSQKHATLTATSQGIKIVDNGSKNGTSINGVDNQLIKHKEYDLNQDMIINFAEVQCKIKLIKGKDEKKNVRAVQEKTGKDKKREEIMEMSE